jgi:hypothetical protein
METKASTVWVGKLVGKWPLARPRRRWVDNIKKDIGNVGGGGRWMDCVQARTKSFATCRGHVVLG